MAKKSTYSPASGKVTPSPKGPITRKSSKVGASLTRGTNGKGC